MKIVYIGNKEVKADNIAATGLTWTKGEIHEVSDEKKALKLLEHPLIWRDADKPYELIPELKAVDPSPRVNLIPQGGENVSPYWEPVTIVVTVEVFKKMQDKSLIAVFMSNEDADAFEKYKAKCVTMAKARESKKAA